MAYSHNVLLLLLLMFCLLISRVDKKHDKFPLEAWPCVVLILYFETSAMPVTMECSLIALHGNRWLFHKFKLSKITAKTTKSIAYRRCDVAAGCTFTHLDSSL